jgi:hypothetical protein
MEPLKDWQKFVDKMNRKGIPVPVIRDPYTGKGSVSLTLLFLSSIWVQVGLIEKLTNKLGGFDMQSAIYWFMACAALYFGRKLGGSKADPTLGDSDAPIADPKAEGSQKPDSPENP